MPINEIRKLFEKKSPEGRQNNTSVRAVGQPSDLEAEVEPHAVASYGYACGSDIDGHIQNGVAHCAAPVKLARHPSGNFDIETVEYGTYTTYKTLDSIAGDELSRGCTKSHGETIQDETSNAGAETSNAGASQQETEKPDPSHPSSPDSSALRFSPWEDTSLVDGQTVVENMNAVSELFIRSMKAFCTLQRHTLLLHREKECLRQKNEKLVYKLAKLRAVAQEIFDDDYIMRI